MNQEQGRKLNVRIKVLFFTSSLGGGGAEMHLLRVMNSLDRQHFSPTIALTRAGGSYESALNRDIQVHFLNSGKIASSTLQMVRSILPLRRLIQTEQPDLVCSVMGHANTVAVLATAGLQNRPKVILSVQNPPSIQSKNIAVKHLLLSLMPHLYPQADRIIALSQGVAKDLKALVPQVSDRIQVIYNAGLDNRVLQWASESLPKHMAIQRPLIVACGRLTEQKGFPYLLDALAKVRQVVPAHLWIVGEGKQRQLLETKIRQLELTNCVKLLGFQPNPFQYMAAADVFALSSIYEGFGNVIVEAMACGTPVVASDCPSGPREIIEHGVSGLLVSTANVEALADALIKVLTHPELRQTLVAEGKQRAQDFHGRAIAAAYGQLFLSVVNTTQN